MTNQFAVLIVLVVVGLSAVAAVTITVNNEERPDGPAVVVGLRRHAERRVRLRHEAGLLPEQKLQLRPRSRHQQRAAATNQSVPLKGNETDIGEIYLTVSVGTPAVDYDLQLDTGSSDTALASTLCGKTCKGQTPLYDPSASASAQAVNCSGDYGLNCGGKQCTQGQCSYSQLYVDGTGYTSLVFADAMSLGLKPFAQIVGAITYENGGGAPFEPAPQTGITGFAYRALSNVNAPTPMDSLVASGQIADVFSMCLTPDGGTMGLGGVLPYYQGALQYTPIVPDSQSGDYLWYEMVIADMRVNGVSLGVNSSVYNEGGAIWDSGTTDVYIPTPAYQALYQLLLNNCTLNPLVGVCGAGKKNIFAGYCYQMTPQQLAAYPDVEVVYAGGASGYIYRRYWVTSDFCGAGYYGIQIDDGGDPSEGSILGEVYLKGIVSVMDRANSRLGFAPSQGCPDGNAN